MVIAHSSYHVKRIKPGLRSSGKKRCDMTTDARGKMATKMLICHAAGTATPRTIIVTIDVMQNANVHLKLFRTLGTSSVKEMLSASFDVAPQLMSILNICENIAWNTWIESPPRKMDMSGIHLITSHIAGSNGFSAIR